jgi:uncharacterized coiled-coil protein SlyX
MFGLVLAVTFNFGTVTRSEAGLKDIWNTVVGWFTGKKGLSDENKQQVTTVLEATNQTQNDVISAINDVMAFQKQVTDLSNPDDQKKLEEKMTKMQQAVEANNQTYMQLMQLQEQLAQAEIKDYDENFNIYITKQKEIEAYYPVIEEKYNELVAFSAPQEQQQQTNVQQESSSTVLAQPWTQPEVRSAINSYLSSNGLDQWGQRIAEGIESSKPRTANGKDRYQFLYETYPKLRDYLAGLGYEQEKVVEQVPSPQEEVIAAEVENDAETEAIVEDLDEEPVQGPAAATSSFGTASNTRTGRPSMAPSNRYSNANLRQKRQEIYKKLNALVAEGKMNTEEYKDLYMEYTKLGDQMKK